MCDIDGLHFLVGYLEARSQKGHGGVGGGLGGGGGGVGGEGGGVAGGRGWGGGGGGGVASPSLENLDYTRARKQIYASRKHARLNRRRAHV